MRVSAAVFLSVIASATPALAQGGAPATPTPALTPPPTAVDGPPSLADEGDQASLLTALARTRGYLASLPRRTLTVAGKAFPVETLRRAYEDFEAIVREQWGKPGFEAAVRARFTWLPMPGRDPSGTVLFTGYYLPLLEASEQPSEVFRYPLYAPPPDMIPLDLGAFRPSLAGQVAMARIKNGGIVPYHTRKEIDEGQALAGRGLEIAWVKDPTLRTSLMIQGSGVLRFPDGRLVNVLYAGQNGHVFVGGDQSRNPSYVFFRLGAEGPTGCDGVPLTGGRAIATDKRLFPTGSLAWISYPRARFNARGQVEAFEQGGRFVLDQDTGGAITGPGRVDVFWGGGDDASRRAHALNGTGRLWFLVPRDETTMPRPVPREEPAGTPPSGTPAQVPDGLPGRPDGYPEP
ncbi:MAG: MltA domain-containing protein [Candidatus Sericytochromatia bacterium]|nr:MltA domain-containing protein [Candidatus Sericytochromatia bacterium]